MKKNLKRLAALLLVVLMVAAILPTAAFADGVDYSAEATIPFEISAHGCAPGANPLDRAANLAYVVEIAAADAESANYMPAVTTFTVSSSENVLAQVPETSAFFPSSVKYVKDGGFKITYNKPGVYHYTVKQTVIDNTSPAYDEYCFYGTVFYNVSVNVTNNDAGGLTAAVVIKDPYNPDNTDKKPTTCAFDNCYGFYLFIEKDWNGISSYRPEVNVVLSHGDYEVTNVSLGENNEWKQMLSVSYDYRDLDKPGLGFSIEEKPVPGGYYAVYVDPVNHWSNMEGGANFYATDLTVKNYHVLIQTGQLNWPIPVLLGLGVLLIGAGVIMLSKKKKNNA